MDRSQGFEKLWEDMFVLAEEYYKQNNNLLIQHSYVVNDTRLGAWISSQRTKYSTNTLDEDRKTKLENIGMIWDVKEYQWMQMYNVAKWYYEKFGDLRIPLRYVTPDGKKLGGWISQQRKNYSRLGTKKANPLFTENKVILLNELEMVWDATDTVQSTSFPEQCIVYYASQADLLFSSRTEYLGVEIDVFFPDFNIGIEYDGERWHKSVQRDIDKNIICRDAGLKLIRIREPKCPEIPHSINYFLKDYSYTELSNVLYEVFVKYFGCNLDIDVEKDQGKIIEQYVVYSKQKWKELIAILSDYKDKHGHIQIGRDDIVGGYRVGSWIHELRKRNKNGTLCISKAQRKQLNDLGMIWNQYEATWNDMYCSAKQYYDEHGNLQVPSTYITEKDSNLLSWLNEQRKKYVKGTLEQDYVEQLNALEFEWTPVQTRWTHMYSLAQQYYRDNGDLLVPARYRVAGENLGNWITVQRKKYLHPTEKTGYLSFEQISKLEMINMVWDVNESQWDEMLILCVRYKEIYGNLRVSRNYVCEGKKLGVWIGQQRVRYNKHDGSISKEHVVKLESLGMIWNELFAKWLDGYDLAKAYYRENGTVNISQKVKYNDKALGKWLYNQKVKYRDGVLSEKQISLLEELHLSW